MKGVAGTENLSCKWKMNEGMKKVMNKNCHECRVGGINRRRSGPPLRVLWYQRSCYQLLLLLFGAHSPA